jgi:hypothetical protein
MMQYLIMARTAKNKEEITVGASWEDELTKIMDVEQITD